METMKKKYKIHKGDQVTLLTGRSRGATGVVESINQKTDRVFVSGANIFKKHKKADASSPDGGIVEKPMPVHISNVAFLDPKTKKASRLGYSMVDGKKVRVSKKSGTSL